MALVLTACHKDEPGITPSGNETNDTTETVVKKYLVREYYADHLENPIRVIDWNDDFSKIIHIVIDSNNVYQIDYSFEYYGNDSMRVVLSQPEYSYGMALFSDYTCHFDDSGRISGIDYYVLSSRQQSEKYNYDESGKLISVVDEEHNCGTRFVWDGDNVCEIYSISSGELESRYGNFFDCFHPYYTIPYLLRSGDSYHSPYLTKPLWKNWYDNNSSGVYHELDEDGYVTCSYRLDDNGERIGDIIYEYLEKSNL